MNDGPPLLEFIDVSVRRRGEALLAGVSINVARGSVHLLVGPNGAGKTTLIGTLLAQVLFEGRIVAHWRASGRIGYVPQAFAVDPTLPVTVQDFLALTRQRRPVCLGVSAAARRRASELLHDVGLEGLERRPLAVLSGGELRRVLLAHALDPRPELLLLDEPASGLDEGGVHQLEDLLLAVRSAGTTVFMVSHDLEQVRRIADRVTVIDRSIVAEGAADEALSHDRVLAMLPSGRSRGARA
ncbi:MAG: metal ABC transporter ATP-binding protein [Acidobacteria bacterium]|nr:metal ABC transporter ATP-binding protein [Acidobacteriota bacterium]